jgi:hypothetical protein
MALSAWFQEVVFQNERELAPATGAASHYLIAVAGR